MRDNLQRVLLDEEIDFADTHPVHQVAANMLRQGEWWFLADRFGRLHTNVTSLPKWLRSHLSVDGQRLVNVDIGESQPLFLVFGLVLADQRGKPRRQAGTGERDGDTQPTHPHTPYDAQYYDAQLPPIGMEKIDRAQLAADLRSYLGLVEDRGLYQAVADRLGVTRDQIKRRVLAAFYDKPARRNRVSRALDELFPSVMETVRRIKGRDYRRLAHFAQRVESAFVFGRVVPRIMATRPDLFIATIHDSILTTTGDGEFVRQIMLDEFAQLGLSPQVKVEPCS